MGSQACSRCSDNGEEEDAAQVLSSDERHKYEAEFEKHVQKALSDGAREVFCEECGVRFNPGAEIRRGAPTAGDRW
eukprot:CAMPEP_0117589386 /NCGR_PEP_ID=MMETSP0784-20121206/70383_1 /TAXON_ID=39447 /ORGANISM="" /LENGTH=75 /DNA_ID=CAMNT_0005390861 /DNA_START=75 /DNA_END=300 /DNA_ORIENTATION=-